jgi:mono/diheme cytochrome c family protein
MNNHFSSVPRPVAGIIFLFFSLLFSGNISAQPDGEKIFKGYCASCHKVDKDMTGPALAGTQDRWSGKEALLYEWIKNPSKVKASGDSYVNELLKVWEPKSGLMTPQALTDEEIGAVLGYIASYVPPAPKDGAAVPAASAEPVAQEDGVGIFFLVLIVLLLLVIILSMSSVRQALSGAVAEQKGKKISEKASYWEEVKGWMWKNKAITSLVVIFFLVLGAVDAWDRLAAVGVYTGYAPEQPIAFNHTLHAGELEINCQYCHSSAEKSKHAGIPSANVCMNCHKAVSAGRSEAGTADIQKIYDAVGWDAEKMAYTGEENPIKWVKVHVLPDHAYFNHSQHVAVAGLECQTCHGPVDTEYTVAEQFAPLTMGWCIQCHNESEIDLNSSAYYEEMHKRFVGDERGREILKKYLEDGSISVKDMGGWECSKCHY